MWVLLVLAVVFLFYIYTSRKHSVFRRYGIPYVEPAPFLGGFKYLSQKGAMQSEYDATMQYGKVVGFFLGNMPTIFLTDPDIIKEIFVKRFSEFYTRSQGGGVSRFWEKTILMTTDLHYWKFLRATMSPTFTAGKLRNMEHIITGGINRTLAAITQQMGDAHEGVFDMVPVYRNLTLEIICQAALGVEIQEGGDSVNEMKRHIQDMLSYSLEKNPVLLLVFLIPDLKYVYNLLDIDYNDTKAIKYISEALKSVITERKAEQGQEKKDLLQLMINTQLRKEALTEQNTDGDSGENGSQPSRGMTDDEIIANATMFLFAGNDTTSTAMIFTTYFLAVNPDCQAKLVAEIQEKVGCAEITYDVLHDMRYLDMFVSESMRLYPPVTRVNRQITHDLTVKDITVPGNMSLTIPVFTLHRIAEFWPEPEKFDPERFSEENKANIKPYTFLPFGVGPRICLGTRFAYMELKMMIVKLLQEFRIKPSADLQVPPRLEKHVFCRPHGGMRLVLEKRQPT